MEYISKYAYFSVKQEYDTKNLDALLLMVWS